MPTLGGAIQDACEYFRLTIDRSETPRPRKGKQARSLRTERPRAAARRPRGGRRASAPPRPSPARRLAGLGEDASYRAAAKGDIPWIRVGGRKRVPLRALEQTGRYVGRFQKTVEMFSNPQATSGEAIKDWREIAAPSGNTQ